MSTARVADLAAQADARQLAGDTGISHTRWATHGAPTPVNAHPHMSGGEIAVVHNGIIENYEALRERLKAQGYVFATQTDTEVIAHLVHAHWHGAAAATCCARCSAAVAEFHGAYAIAVISTREPGRVVGARAGQPARRRPRRGRSLPRLRRRGAAVGHAARRLSRGRRRRRRPARVVRDLRRARRSASSARSSTSRRRGDAVELGPVPPLHAEGDLRAAARGGRHARRRRAASTRRCSAPSAARDPRAASTAC